MLKVHIQTIGLQSVNLINPLKVLLLKMFYPSHSTFENTIQWTNWTLFAGPTHSCMYQSAKHVRKNCIPNGPQSRHLEGSSHYARLPNLPDHTYRGDTSLLHQDMQKTHKRIMKDENLVSARKNQATHLTWQLGDMEQVPL